MQPIHGIGSTIQRALDEIIPIPRSSIEGALGQLKMLPKNAMIATT
jgi:hypothetical protein